MGTTRSARRDAPPGPRRREALATAARWAAVGLAAIAVAALGLITLGTVTGRLVVQTVPTGSMEPMIPEGSAIVVTPLPVGEVAVGDVIVFAAPETGLTTVHRVTDVVAGETGPLFNTKGDANEGADPWQLSVPSGQVHEVREVVPVAGAVLTTISGPAARLVLAALGAALVLGVGLRQVWRRPTPARGAAPDTWDRALAGVLDGSPSPAAADDLAVLALLPTPSVATTDGAILDLSDASPGSDRSRRAGGRVGAGGMAVTVLALVVGLVAVAPPGTARASFTDAAVAVQPVGTTQVPTRTAVRCAWSSATAITTTWTTPPGGTGDQTQLLTATSPTATPTVASTALAGATTAATNPSPVTTVRYLSTRAVRGTWSSLASPQMATNTCTGSITRYAGQGNGSFAGDGGVATAASLRTPYQLAEGPDGRVFIADAGNNRIRVVATNGTISTLVGGGSTTACTYTGPATGVSLSGPRGVAVDAAGNVYVADSGNACIRKVDTSGNVSRVAGGGSTTTCTSASVAATALSLSNPSALAVAPDGSVVVADTGRNCVRRVTGTTATLVAGGGSTTTCSATALTATTVSLSGPMGVAVTSTGDIVVADTGRDCVRRVSGTAVTRVAGGGSTTSCTAATTPAALALSDPEGVDVAADGSIVVADTGRDCVRQISATAVTPLAFTGTNGTTGDDGPASAARAASPSGVAVLASGDVLISDRATASGANDVRRVEMG